MSQIGSPMGGPTNHLYGGACSNAALKVLYDAANEAVGAAQTVEAL
jgi:hypothetical protein